MPEDHFGPEDVTIRVFLFEERGWRWGTEDGRGEWVKVSVASVVSVVVVRFRHRFRT